MSKQNNIFLIGLMGVGKSSIGRALATALDLDFYDSDQEIEKRTGATISWIFDIEGEAGFRQRESKIIDDLTQLQGIVLATGGGVVLDPNNREALKSRGLVIYLHAHLEDLVSRTGRHTHRPLLQNNDPKEVLKQLLQKREPLYREIADYTFDTSSASVHEIVQQICAQLKGEQHADR